jgi:hypothetical protein
VRPSEFLLEEDHLGVSLRARASGEECCILRAEAARDLSSKLFASPREAEQFLFPPDAPRAQFSFEDSAIRADEAHALEPLRVFELRSDYLDDPRRFPPQSLVLDCAWRAVEQRLAFALERGRRDRLELHPSSRTSPALPAL